MNLKYISEAIKFLPDDYGVFVTSSQDENNLMISVHNDKGIVNHIVNVKFYDDLEYLKVLIQALKKELDLL